MGLMPKSGMTALDFLGSGESLWYRWPVFTFPRACLGNASAFRIRLVNQYIIYQYVTGTCFILN